MTDNEVLVAQMQIRANLAISLAENGFKSCDILAILREFFIWIPPKKKEDV